VTRGTPQEDKQAIASAVFAIMADGESLRTACESAGVKVPTLLLWIDGDPKLAEQYTRAMLARADAKFEELDAVSEQAARADSAVTINGLRLKADNIKWQLARMNARKYGDRTTIAGDPEAPLSGTDEQLLARAAAILASAKGEGSGG